MYRKVLFDEIGILRDSMKKIHVSNFAYLEIDKSYFFNEIPFYVMSGYGEINFKDLPLQKPSFNKINIENLDYFLQNEEHTATDYAEQAQIEAFYKMYRFNEIHEKPKLYTQSYNDLEKTLYGYASNIKKY